MFGSEMFLWLFDGDLEEEDDFLVLSYRS